MNFSEYQNFCAKSDKNLRGIKFFFSSKIFNRGDPYDKKKLKILIKCHLYLAQFVLIINSIWKNFQTFFKDLDIRIKYWESIVWIRRDVSRVDLETEVFEYGKLLKNHSCFSMVFICKFNIEIFRDLQIKRMRCCFSVRF